MTELTFVDEASGVPMIIEIAFNRIIRFSTIKDGIPQYTTLEGLNFSPAGIVKEFPDLKGMEIPKMKRIAVKRFKKHLAKLKTESETINYLKEDLAKHGYKGLLVTRKGFRARKM